MSDELVIERIRGAMHDAVEGLEPRRETLARALAAPPRRRLSFGWVAPALAVGVAALVAVVAITSLAGHGRGASSTTNSRVPRGAQGLVRDLAVLRRPQTAADRLPQWAMRAAGPQLPGGALVPSLSRAVASVQLAGGGTARVYLVVDAPSRSVLRAVRSSHRDGDVAAIAFVGKGVSGRNPDARSVFVGGLVPGTPKGSFDPSDLTGVSGAKAAIVPDGVARVKWVFTPMGRDSGLPAITVWPKLQGNVAIGHVPTRLPPGEVPSRLQVFLSSAVWYGADGRALQSSGAMTGVPASQRSFKHDLQMSVHDPVDPALLSRFRLLRTTRPSGSSGLDRAAVKSVIQANEVDLNLAKTRFVVSPTTHAKVWVTPGTQGIALRTEDPNLTFGTEGASLALSGSLFNTGRVSHGKLTLTGLAPDGNRVVNVLVPGGVKLTAPVIDNVYSLIVPTNARTLLIHNAAGRLVRVHLVL